MGRDPAPHTSRCVQIQDKSRNRETGSEGNQVQEQKRGRPRADVLLRPLALDHEDIIDREGQVVEGRCDVERDEPPLCSTGSFRAGGKEHVRCILRDRPGAHEEPT